MKIVSSLLSLAIVALAAAAPAAHAEPAPLRIVVPYAPGGSGDMIARTLGERVGAKLGQTIVVENKPGGGTVIGAQAVATAPANGEHVLLVAASFVINSHLMPKMPFDPLKDFAPVAMVASNPHVLVVSTKVPARNLKEFLAWAGERKGSATYASFGSGSSGHLGFELFKKAGKFDMVHVPYKGSAPAMTDLLGGHVDAMLTDLPQAAEAIKAGKIKAIAVASAKRAATLPDVPTFSEAGLAGFESKSWYGLVVRSGAPDASVTALNQAFTGALAEPEVRAKFAQNGLDIAAGSAADFGAFMQRESAKFGEIVKSANIRLD